MFIHFLPPLRMNKNYSSGFSALINFFLSNPFQRRKFHERMLNAIKKSCLRRSQNFSNLLPVKLLKLCHLIFQWHILSTTVLPVYLIKTIKRNADTRRETKKKLMMITKLFNFLSTF